MTQIEKISALRAMDASKLDELNVERNTLLNRIAEFDIALKVLRSVETEDNVDTYQISELTEMLERAIKLGGTIGTRNSGIVRRVSQYFGVNLNSRAVTAILTEMSSGDNTNIVLRGRKWFHVSNDPGIEAEGDNLQGQTLSASGSTQTIGEDDAAPLV